MCLGKQCNRYTFPKRSSWFWIGFSPRYLTLNFYYLCPSIHPLIHQLQFAQGFGPRGSKLSREAQTSLSLPTWSSSPGVIPRCSHASQEFALAFPPVCSGFSFGCPSGETCPKHFNREVVELVQSSPARMQTIQFLLDLRIDYPVDRPLQIFLIDLTRKA